MRCQPRVVRTHEREREEGVRAWHARSLQFSDAELEEGPAFSRITVAEHAVRRKQIIAVAGRAERAAHAAAKLGGEAEDVIGQQRPVRSRPRVCEERHIAAIVWHRQLHAADH